MANILAFRESVRNTDACPDKDACKNKHCNKWHSGPVSVRLCTDYLAKGVCVRRNLHLTHRYQDCRFSHDETLIQQARDRLNYHLLYDEARKSRYSLSFLDTDINELLPNEVLVNILGYACADLQSYDVLTMVCKKWKELVETFCRDQIYIPMQISLDKNNFGSPLTYKTKDYVTYTKPLLEKRFGDLVKVVLASILNDTVVYTHIDRDGELFPIEEGDEDYGEGEEGIDAIDTELEGAVVSDGVVEPEESTDVASASVAEPEETPETSPAGAPEPETPITKPEDITFEPSYISGTLFCTMRPDGVVDGPGKIEFYYLNIRYKVDILFSYGDIVSFDITETMIIKQSYDTGPESDYGTDYDDNDMHGLIGAYDTDDD